MLFAVITLGSFTLRKGKRRLREQSWGDWIKKQNLALLSSKVFLQSNIIRTINVVPPLQNNPVISVVKVDIFAFSMKTTLQKQKNKIKLQLYRNLPLVARFCSGTILANGVSQPFASQFQSTCPSPFLIARAERQWTLLRSLCSHRPHGSRPGTHPRPCSPQRS